MTFNPHDCPDRWYGLLAVIGLLLLSGLGAMIVIGRPVDGLSFLLILWVLGNLAAAAYISYRTLGAFTLEYWVDRDAVTMVWGPTRQIIPIGAIQEIILGTSAPALTPPRPWHWPCTHRRRVQYSNELGLVNAYATRSSSEQIFLITHGESFSVSPADATEFVRALQERFALGPTRQVQLELQRPPLWTWSLWRDRVALFLIGAGLFGVLLMFGVLSFRFPHLSSDLPLHFDVNGFPDRISSKTGLFALPVIGLLAWGFNLIAGIVLYRRVQRGAAYLLWGGALVVEAIAGLALFNLMRW
jgi:hypothetical protein